MSRLHSTFLTTTLACALAGAAPAVAGAAAALRITAPDLQRTLWVDLAAARIYAEDCQRAWQAERSGADAAGADWTLLLRGPADLATPGGEHPVEEQLELRAWGQTGELVLRTSLSPAPIRIPVQIETPGVSPCAG